jgi:hypothetical protein
MLRGGQKGTIETQGRGVRAGKGRRRRVTIVAAGRGVREFHFEGGRCIGGSVAASQALLCTFVDLLKLQSLAVRRSLVWRQTGCCCRVRTASLSATPTTNAIVIYMLWAKALGGCWMQC